MLKKGRGRVDIVIDERDLADPMPEIIRITEKELNACDSGILTITFEELDQFFIQVDEKDLPSIVQISYEDLPPILKVRMEDLPPDLNYMTTECYHGTSWLAAENIRKVGFKVGSGAAGGAGIYFSVGGMSIARSYAKGKKCIIRARVNWGRVAYRDNAKFPSTMRGSGNSVAIAAKRLGYDSILYSSKFSKSNPTTGIVLGTIGSHIKPPRIEVMELIDPSSM